MDNQNEMSSIQESSTPDTSTQDSSMSTLMATLKDVWQEKMKRNEEVRRARLDLDHHRNQMEKLVQDLNSSEAWERELEERRIAVEHMCKPPLLRYSESLDKLSLGIMVAGSLLEELAEEVDWKHVLQVTRNKIIMSETLGRFEKIMLLKILFRFQDFYLVKDVPDAVAVVHELIRKLLLELGDPGQNWGKLSPPEAEVMMNVVKEVDGIPPFVVRLLEYLLTSNQGENRLVLRETASQTSCESGHGTDQNHQKRRKFLDHGEDQP